MVVELNRRDLLKLVKSTEPHYGAFNHPLVKKCGQYVGWLGEHWEWHGDGLNKLNDEKLFELYQICQDETINIPTDAVEDKYPITEEQRKNMPGFDNLMDILNWEFKTSIDNDIIGELIEICKEKKENN